MAAKNIKIFIASAGEVKAEREKAILLLNDLRKAHKHLDLEAVEWEYDTVPGSQPGFETVQDAINPKLAESHIAVFIFYSRIGHYTKLEFDLAQQLGKKFFVLFKEGFSPTDEEIAAYSDLLQFKKSLNKTVLHEPYTDEKDFYSRLYRSLNVYLYETYPAMAGPLPDEVLRLLRELAQKEDRIKELEDLLPASTNIDEVKKLTAEITTIKNELAQSEELRQQQAADKAALEQQLAGQQANDQLKAQALGAVEKGDYVEAEILLKESAKDSIAATASTFYELAKIKKLQLQYREAFKFYELAATIEPENSLYLHEAGGMAWELGLNDKAIEYHETSLKFSIVELGEQNPDVAARYMNLGLVYRHKGLYDKAIYFNEKALDIFHMCYGEQHSDVASGYNNLAVIYCLKGEYDKAIYYCEKALTIELEVSGEQNDQIEAIYNNLGGIYLNLADYDKAISYFNKVLAIVKESYIDFCHPNIAKLYNNLGESYRRCQEHDEAIAYYKRALHIAKQIYGERHPEIATYNNNLGLAYLGKCEYDTAIVFCELAINISKDLYSGQNISVATYYNNLGGIYCQMFDYSKAIACYEKALSIFEEFLPASHPYIKAVLKSLQFVKTAHAQKD
jgi:tetratricopeptide (TPR) repeat protein